MHLGYAVPGKHKMKFMEIAGSEPSIILHLLILQHGDIFNEL